MRISENETALISIDHLVNCSNLIRPSKVLKHREPSIKQTSEAVWHPDKRVSAKYGQYHFGHAINQCERYIWSKNQIVSRLLRAMCQKMREDDIYISLILMRTLLETLSKSLNVHQSITALYITFKIDCPENITTVFEKEKLDQLYEGFNKFSEMIQQATLTSSINLREYYENRKISGQKRKDYVPSDREIDLSAKNILSSIDLLDKTIRGSRRLYDFLSQFAHPNFGQYYLSMDPEILTHSSVDGLATVERTMMPRSFDCLIEPIHDLIVDSLDLLVKIVDLYISKQQELRSSLKDVRKTQKKLIVGILKNSIGIWRKTDLCPCCSGEPINLCCGKKHLNRLR